LLIIFIQKDITQSNIELLLYMTIVDLDFTFSREENLSVCYIN